MIFYPSPTELINLFTQIKIYIQNGNYDGFKKYLNIEVLHAIQGINCDREVSLTGNKIENNKCTGFNYGLLKTLFLDVFLHSIIGYAYIH